MKTNTVAAKKGRKERTDCRFQVSRNTAFYNIFPLANYSYSITLFLNNNIHYSAPSCHNPANVCAYPKTSRHNFARARRFLANVFQVIKTVRQNMASGIHLMAKACRLLANIGGSLKKCFQNLLNSRKCLTNIRQIKITVFYFSPITYTKLREGRKGGYWLQISSNPLSYWFCIILHFAINICHLLNSFCHLLS